MTANNSLRTLFSLSWSVPDAPDPTLETPPSDGALAVSVAQSLLDRQSSFADVVTTKTNVRAGTALTLAGLYVSLVTSHRTRYGAVSLAVVVLAVVFALAIGALALLAGRAGTYRTGPEPDVVRQLTIEYGEERQVGWEVARLYEWSVHCNEPFYEAQLWALQACYGLLAAEVLAVGIGLLCAL